MRSFKILSTEIRLIYPIKALHLPIESYEHYRVSYWSGIVFNTRNRNVLSSWRNENGYRRIRLNNGKKTTCLYVHRLVALSYIYNSSPIEKGEVNHIDNIRHNCDVPNLEWMSRQENMAYKYNRHTKKFDEIELYPIEENNRIKTPPIGMEEDLPF